MNYVLDTRTATAHFPGIGRYVSNLARSLPSLLYPDERLWLLGPGGDVDPAATPSSGEPASVQRLAAPSSPFSLPQQWQIPRLLRQIRAARPGPTVYHSPYYLMPYWPRLPTLLTFYDLIPLRFPEHVSLRARLLFRATMTLALRAADHLIAISAASARDLVEEFSVDPARVTAVPLAAEPRFQPQPAEVQEQFRQRAGLPSRFLLYVGINKPHKNLTSLIDAYARLGSPVPPLVIAGAWDDRYPEVRQRATALLPPHTVRFLGSVPELDLPALYASATLFVFPSRYEGFGLPVLEAMACGTPVACAHSSSLPEVAGDAALLFDPDQPASIAAALGRLLADAPLRAECSRRGLVQAARFSWQRTAQTTLEIYRRISHRSAHSRTL